MKLYQFCALVCVACWATADGNVIATADCEQDIKVLEDSESKCWSEFIGREVFESDYNATILKYNAGEDTAAVQEFLNKYCENGIDGLDCYLNIKPTASELNCDIRPKLRLIKPTIMRGTKAFATYLCKNDAEILKKLLPYDGLDTVFFNTNFELCHSIRADLSTIHEYCKSLDTTLSCMLTTIGDHKNKDLAVIANNVIEQAKTAAGC